MPPYVVQIRMICVDAPCSPPGQLNADGLRAIEQLGLTLNAYSVLAAAVFAGSAGVWLTAACIVFWRGRSDRIALITATFLVTGSAAAANILRETAAASHPVWWLLGATVQAIGALALALFVAVFPAGGWVPGWTRWLALGWAAFLLPDAIVPGSPIDSATWPAELLLPVLVGLAGSTVHAQVWRFRRLSNVVQQQQTKWAVFGLTAALLGWSALVAVQYLVIPKQEWIGSPAVLMVVGAFRVVLLAIPLSIAVAVSRYRLWDIDPIVRRSLVYAGLTVAVVGLYILVVGYFGVFFQIRDSPFPSLLAAGLVAVLFQPLRERLQRGVNRLLYGQRDEPYAVLAGLSRRLEATLAPDTVLSTIVETIRDALKVPYVAIRLCNDPNCVSGASSGSPVEPHLCLPLVYQNEPVGELLLAPRAPSESFNPADRRLLEDLARQVGVAAHAVQLTADLQRSRERLVSAREEERRRLRRDLHDGLGPVLAGLTLQLDAARGLLQQDPLAADALLGDLKARTQAAVSDVRRLAYALRPPALDDLGLAPALCAAAAQYEANPSCTRISVEIQDNLPPLPAAVEVATYRIAQEALANAIRHADASKCVLRLNLNSAAEMLCLEVIDDGQGLPASPVSGVGLHSMRERAAELGGSCAVEALPSSGTRVYAQLPCKVLSAS